MLVEKADSATTKLDGEQMSDVCRSMKECEWYQVGHGGVVEEGEGYDRLCLERVGRAREVYEEGLSLSTGSSDAEADSV